MKEFITVEKTPMLEFQIPLKYSNYTPDKTGNGSGTLGIVRKFDGPGMSIAIKKFQTPFQNKTRAGLILRELNLLKSMNHPNVVRLIDMYTVDGRPEQMKSIYHITEHCGVELTNIIAKGGYSMIDVKRRMRDLLSALQYINSLGVSHRNLNPKNMCINNTGKLTLLGFGKARVLADEGNTGSRGTDPYQAFELAVEMKDGDYDEKVDIWSMATILCEMITGLSLFSGPDVKNVMVQIIKFCGPVDDAVISKMKNENDRNNFTTFSSRSKRIDFIALLKQRANAQRGISEKDIAKEHHLADFIDKTLQFNPKHRMSAHRCLAHPFLGGSEAPTEVPLPNDEDDAIAECREHIWDAIHFWTT